MPSLDPIVSPKVRTLVHRHARQRAAERYALDLTPADVETIVDRIARKHVSVVQLRRDNVQSHRIHVVVRWQRRWMIGIYDEATRTLVTVLPDIALAGYDRVLQRANARMNAAARVADDEPADGICVAYEHEAEAETVPEPPSGPPVGTILGHLDMTAYLDQKLPDLSYAPSTLPITTKADVERRRSVLRRNAKAASSYLHLANQYHMDEAAREAKKAPFKAILAAIHEERKALKLLEQELIGDGTPIP